MMYELQILVILFSVVSFLQIANSSRIFSTNIYKRPQLQRLSKASQSSFLNVLDERNSYRNFLPTDHSVEHGPGQSLNHENQQLLRDSTAIERSSKRRVFPSSFIQNGAQYNQDHQRVIAQHANLEPKEANVKDTATSNNNVTATDPKESYTTKSVNVEEHQNRESDEELVDDPMASVANMNDKELLKILGISRPRPKISDIELEYFKELGDRGSAALEYAIKHPEGAEYHEVVFSDTKNTTYIETHIVRVPSGNEVQEDLCRFALTIDSPFFKVSPIAFVLSSSLLRLITALVSVDAEECGTSLNAHEAEFLPSFILTVQGNCQQSMNVMRSFTKLVGDYSIFSFKGEMFSDQEKLAISRSFLQFVIQKIKKAEHMSTKEIESILNELIDSISLHPYFSNEDIVSVTDSMPQTNALDFADLARDILSESMSNAHVSLLAVVNAADTATIKNDRILEFAKSIGNDMDFTKIKSIEYLNTYRKVELPSYPHRVVVEKSVSIPNLTIASIIGLYYQIIENDVIGIKRHQCQTILILDALVALGRSLSSSLLSDSTPLPLDNERLRKEFKSAGIQRVEMNLRDPYEDAPYIEIKGIATSARASNVENAITRFLIYLGNVIKKSQNGEIIGNLTKINWSPEPLLFKSEGTSQFDNLADFYMNQIQQRTYDFSRPMECMEAYGTLKDVQPHMTALYDKFLGTSKTTRSVVVLLDNEVQDVATAIAQLKGNEEVPIEDSVLQKEALSFPTTNIKTSPDIIRFISTCSLLPSASALPSIILHEIYRRGWEGEEPPKSIVIAPKSIVIAPKSSAPLTTVASSTRDAVQTSTADVSGIVAKANNVSGNTSSFFSSLLMIFSLLIAALLS